MSMRMKLVSTFALMLSLVAMLLVVASTWNSAVAAPLDIQTKDIQTKNSSELTAQSANFGAALLSVASLRLYYMEHLEMYGQSPESIDDLGLSEHDFQGELVEHVGISSQTGAILVGLNDQFGDKHWAALIPTIEQYQVTSWRCQTTLNQASVGNVDCKSGVAYSQVDHIFDPSVLLSSFIGVRSLRIGYSAFHQENGGVPTSTDDFEVDTDFLKARHISHVMVDPNTMTMLVGLDDNMYGSNQWVATTPIFYNNYFIVGWDCRTSLSSQIVATAGLNSCAAGQGLDDLL